MRNEADVFVARGAQEEIDDHAIFRREAVVAVFMSLNIASLCFDFTKAKCVDDLDRVARILVPVKEDADGFVEQGEVFDDVCRVVIGTQFT